MKTKVVLLVWTVLCHGILLFTYNLYILFRVVNDGYIIVLFPWVNTYPFILFFIFSHTFFVLLVTTNKKSKQHPYFFLFSWIFVLSKSNKKQFLFVKFLFMLTIIPFNFRTIFQTSSCQKILILYVSTTTQFYFGLKKWYITPSRVF